MAGQMHLYCDAWNKKVRTHHWRLPSCHVTTCTGREDSPQTDISCNWPTHGCVFVCVHGCVCMSVSDLFTHTSFVYFLCSF